MEVINGEKKYVKPFSSPNVSITNVSLVDASVEISKRSTLEFQSEGMID